MNSQPEDVSVFSNEFTVSEEDTDQNRHVNNVVYVRWMQDIAKMHSDSYGATEAMKSANRIWVVRSHNIEYLNPGFAGDLVVASTWIDSYRRVRAVRGSRFIRKSDGKILARGKTEWICVDAENGKPCSIPEEIKLSFPEHSLSQTGV